MAEDGAEGLLVGMGDGMRRVLGACLLAVLLEDIAQGVGLGEDCS
jgi:proteasome assembly chaperone (PAC2) family protein